MRSIKDVKEVTISGLINAFFNKQLDGDERNLRGRGACEDFKCTHRQEIRLTSGSNMLHGHAHKWVAGKSRDGFLTKIANGCNFNDPCVNFPVASVRQCYVCVWTISFSKIWMQVHTHPRLVVFPFILNKEFENLIITIPHLTPHIDIYISHMHNLT